MIYRALLLTLSIALTHSALAQPTPPESPAPQAIEAKPVPIADGQVSLTPENTLIQFIGTHVGDKPDPRVGNFQKFKGTAMVDAASKTIQSIEVEIETPSLSTPLPPLTVHLNSPDFFDTRQFPTATFKTTAVEPTGQENEVNVQGELTLLGVSKPIEFPAMVTWTDNTMSLKAEFAIDRTDFGMSFAPDRVEKSVAMTVAIGSPTGRAGGDQAGRGGRRNFDPEAMFKERDQDGNGSWAGEEIPERMRDRIAEIDTDKNGEISKEEFDARMRQFGRGGGGGGRDRGPRSQGRPQRPKEEETPKE
jgi:polyisoprenoid-binding protein YceI